MTARVVPLAAARPHGDLMREMMARIGIDLWRVGKQNFGEKLAYASRTCLSCDHAAACQAWLRVGRPADAYRRFCPNAALFDTFPRRRPLPF